MKHQMIKMPGGLFAPADSIEEQRLTRYKNAELFEVEIKNKRNASFHRKVFVFINFCFDHWCGGNEYQDIAAQRDKFRKDLIILAGYYVEVYNYRGQLRLTAKSLAFESMSQEEFEQCYSALINAAMKHIFRTADENTYNQLLSFF